MCISVLGIVCPAVMEICIIHNNDATIKHRLTIVKNIFFIIVGLVGLVIGTYTSVRNIVEKMTGNDIVVGKITGSDIAIDKIIGGGQ